MGWPDSLLRVSQGWNQSVDWAELSSGGSGVEKSTFQIHFCCWQNSVCCGYRTVVVDSLLVESQGLLCAFRAYSHFLTHCPSIFKLEMEHWNPFPATDVWLCPQSLFVHTKLDEDCEPAESLLKNYQVLSKSFKIICASDCFITV